MENEELLREKLLAAFRALTEAISYLSPPELPKLMLWVNEDPHARVSEAKKMPSARNCISRARRGERRPLRRAQKSVAKRIAPGKRLFTFRRRRSERCRNSRTERSVRPATGSIR